MKLVFSIAMTHVMSRVRQSLVGILGVATGVGFSVMMAALMEGSQNDFIDTLIDAIPHITISDERREPPVQPATQIYDAAQIHGLNTAVIRPGIKNPLAIMSTLETWIPGAIAPSVVSKAIVRFAGRDIAASVTGIDPKREITVSKLTTYIKQGSIDDLYKASNAIILGDRLASKIGARIGNTVVVVAGNGQLMSCTVVGLMRTGNAVTDESQAYTLLKTGQILAGQTGLVNSIRIKLRDVMNARSIATRVERETGYKAVSWQEASEDLMSALQIRNFIMYTVVGAILLVASFGTYNIISTITHEKTRDIAILKSLGFTRAMVQRIFLVEALAIGVAGMVCGWVLGYLMTLGLGTIEIRTPFADASNLPVIVSPLHYLLAGGVALGASAIAGYMPARKAARVQPVDIIRGAS